MPSHCLPHFSKTNANFVKFRMMYNIISDWDEVVSKKILDIFEQSSKVTNAESEKLAR